MSLIRIGLGFISSIFSISFTRSDMISLLYFLNININSPLRLDKIRLIFPFGSFLHINSSFKSYPNLINLLIAFCSLRSICFDQLFKEPILS